VELEDDAPGGAPLSLPYHAARCPPPFSSSISFTNAYYEQKTATSKPDVEIQGESKTVWNM
jgi:hypothetical protein